MGKKIVVYIVNFFLMVAIVVLASLLIFSSTILDKQYVLGALKDNNYYDKTDFDIKDTFKNYIMQSGLEESILEDLYNKEKLNSDINNVIDGIYENKEVDIDTDGIKSTLDSRINETLKENNRKPTQSDKESIQIFENTIVEVYEDGIILSKSVVGRIGDVVAKVITLVQKAKVAVIVAVVALIIVIVAINRNVQDSMRAFGAAILSSGLIFIALKLFIGKRLQYVLILNNTFSDMLINTSEAIVSTFLNAGIVMAIVGLLIIIAGSIQKKEAEYNRRH